MKWQKKHNKRRRQLLKHKKPAVIVLMSLCGVLLMAGGIYYFSVLYKPLYISPLPLLKTVQGVEDRSVEQIIAAELKKKGIMYETIDITESSAIIVRLKDNGEVFLTSDKEISPQIASLQVILVRLTMEGKQFRKLDLRFDKPVIVFKDRKIMLDEVKVPTIASSSGQSFIDSEASPSASSE